MTMSVEQIVAIISILALIVAWLVYLNDRTKMANDINTKEKESFGIASANEQKRLQMQKDIDGLGMKIRDLQSDHGDLFNAHAIRINEIEKQNALTNQQLSTIIGMLKTHIEKAE